MNTSDKLGAKILDSLGISKERCVKANIIIEGGEPLKVFCEYYTNYDGTGPINDETQLKEFELVEKS